MATIFTEKPEPLDLRQRTGASWWVSAWLPPLLAVLVIARESTPLFSAANTSSWLLTLYLRLFGSVGPTRWDQIHMFIRKSGHFTGYGLVCLSFLRAWLLTLARGVDLRRRVWRLRAVALSLASTACVASLDEWHQTFLPSRTGQLSDVLLDTAGASLLCALVWVLFWRPRRRSRRR